MTIYDHYDNISDHYDQNINNPYECTDRLYRALSYIEFYYYWMADRLVYMYRQQHKCAGLYPI